MSSDGERFFDACLLADDAMHSAELKSFYGAIVYGDSGEMRRENFFRAGELRHVVGENDPRFPRNADVIDLQLPPEELIRHLKEPPAHWWPLCGTAREGSRRTILHIEAGEFSSTARGLSRLARAFPAVIILVDPFRSGKESKWQAGVCLAEEKNIWLTTRGLYGAETLWPDRSEREALHFVMGEVGAGKLLFASGLRAQNLAAQATSPARWLETIDFLDAAQRELVLWRNAHEALK